MADPNTLVREIALAIQKLRTARAELINKQNAANIAQKTYLAALNEFKELKSQLNIELDNRVAVDTEQP